jgi:NADH:ubiquinone oxidoreductase subunit 3 (subunit A)
MFLVSLSLLISFLIVLFLKVLAFFVSEKSPIIREEMSSFECGFEHHSLSRVPFSLRYFFLTLIFLLFDLEIVLMMFLPSLLFSSSLYFSLGVLCIFIIILYLGLIYE